MEMITEVDQEDNVIGARPKIDFEDPQHIHRSSHLFLYNSKGEILLQRRAFSKIKYPGLLDYSVSGTVAKDETYEETIEREMKEELDIEIEFQYALKYFFIDDYDAAFKTLFIGRYDGDFKIQEEEVDSLVWMTLEELKRDIVENPEKFCGPFLYGIKKYLEQ